MVGEGHRAVALFVIQRTDCDRFAAAADKDPLFAQALLRAASAGVEVICYACEISPQSVRISHRVPWADQSQALSPQDA